MTTEEMLENIKKYYDSELQSVERVFNSNVHDSFWYEDLKSCIVPNAIQRCLGIALFVQSLGITYEEITPLFENVRKDLEKYHWESEE